MFDTCRCSWPPPASPFSLLITVAMIKDMVHESSPNLGHLEGWGALLALHLRGAPSSWARPPASPCRRPAQPCPPHHRRAQLILLSGFFYLQLLKICTFATPLAPPLLRGSCVLLNAWHNPWLVFAKLLIQLSFHVHVLQLPSSILNKSPVNILKGQIKFQMDSGPIAVKYSLPVSEL